MRHCIADDLPYWLETLASWQAPPTPLSPDTVEELQAASD